MQKHWRPTGLTSKLQGSNCYFPWFSAAILVHSARHYQHFLYSEHMLQLHCHHLPSICHQSNEIYPSRNHPNSSIFSPSNKSHLSIALSMESAAPKFVYSVWGLPPEDRLAPRLRELMGALRSAFGGPLFEPHVTVVGAIELTEEDALKRFRSACDGLKAYTATVDRVATGTFFYQCVYLLLNPTAEVNSDVLCETETDLISCDIIWNVCSCIIDLLGHFGFSITGFSEKNVEILTLGSSLRLLCICFAWNIQYIEDIRPADFMMGYVINETNGNTSTSERH